jgi:hypothetical protein
MYDGFEARLFVNGALAQASNASYQPTTNRPIQVGARPAGSSADRFIGLIDELRVFDVPRSPAQIMAASNRRVNN